MAGREDNVRIFEDSMKLCKKNERLKESIKNSTLGQEMYDVTFKVENGTTGEKSLTRYEKPAEVIVSKKRTLEAAKVFSGKKVCVLNFASATNPGGGVTRGSTAQEECICRCSTLYPLINEKKMWDMFYGPHRKLNNPLYNDDCIYTPNVTVFKSDTASPSLLKEREWYDVNVITCAAPNLRKRPSNMMNPHAGSAPVKITDKELKELHIKRGRKILQIAAAQGNEVVILGAFGCGAFENSPMVVAESYKELVEEFRYQFETIEFAVYCPPNKPLNYDVFKRVIV